MKAGIGIWALRIFLAVAFLFFGLLKFREGDGSLYVRIFELIGFGQWFRYFTGVVEVGGALLMLFPRATPVAVALLAPTMIGALLTHVLVIGPQPASVVVVMLLAGVLYVGWRYRASAQRATRAAVFSASPTGRPSTDS
jgi:putative oxidoreductase